VIGGCFDEEFAEWSNALMADFRDQRFRLVVSDVTAAEVAMAPEPIRELFSELLAGADVLQITQEALELVSAYEEHGILRPRFRNDMLHIAIATVAEVDVVRRIRDEQAKFLEGKSNEEIIDFFRRAGDAAKLGDKFEANSPAI
jgi:hypothetical protein